MDIFNKKRIKQLEVALTEAQERWLDERHKVGILIMEKDKLADKIKDFEKRFGDFLTTFTFEIKGENHE